MEFQVGVASVAEAADEGLVAKSILRWIAVVPAALLGAVVGGLLAYVMTSIVLEGVVKGLPPQVNEFVRTLVMGGFFVYTGAHVAPSKRMAVPIALAGGWCAVVAAVLAYTAGNPDIIFAYGDAFAYIDGGLSCVVAILTAVSVARDA